MINDWNSLPNSVVESTLINTFKSLLDNYLLDVNALIGYTGLTFTSLVPRSHPLPQWVESGHETIPLPVLIIIIS